MNTMMVARSVSEFRSQLLFNIYKRVCSGEKKLFIDCTNREWLPFEREKEKNENGLTV